ncbi:leucyl aminopeptidase [Kitasatospora gansuensis]|uniref:Probable cytosol aminopeptidase n=1 Tax=Kitasatospora gansuensis TaxID=258050 RepID=A0A7W7S6B8_9ACTN|nr:leucyl aminopeptidase [Kitasatospora gansuensis]MBB4944704.1 leucyl aminopeptidase [Kitasatospora gansuensis]
MSAEWRLTPRQSADVEALVTPVWSDDLPADLTPAFLTGSGFSGAPGQTLQLPDDPVTVLLGCGPRAGYGRDTARAVGARLARAMTGYRRLAVRAPEAELRALVEGYLLGGYRFAGYFTTAPGIDQRIDLVTADTPETRAALAAGRRVGEAVLLARDLVNEPGEALTPPEFAERALKLAAASGLECEVWDAERIAHERLGGLLGVSRGSLLPPRLVRLSYRPAGPASRRIALVGKGVTYDAGGLSLKPNAELAAMKADMAGAAAVLAAMSTLAALNCPVAVDGWLPLTENMPNGNPIRVGDVLRMRSGTTVEIRHADAEGRLILADALTLAGETAPDAIIDLATLTDAAAVALGRRITAVMGTDDTLTEALRAAGRRAGEELWPLPLPDSYRGQLTSRVADLANYTIGVRHGTALLAGLFLREFVPPDIPWAHLDIQGTALSDTDDGEWVPGGTGVGVRTLIDYLLTGGG